MPRSTPPTGGSSMRWRPASRPRHARRWPRTSRTCRLAWSVSPRPADAHLPRMKTLVRNVGALVSGDLRRPLLDADSLVLRDGVIAAVGRGLDEDADTVIDARGTTVLPGLIDS